jgi:hypothetical protein
MGSFSSSARSSDALTDAIKPATPSDTQSSQYSTRSGRDDNPTDTPGKEESASDASVAQKEFASDIDGDSFAETYLNVVLVGLLCLVGFGGALSS